MISTHRFTSSQFFLKLSPEPPEKRWLFWVYSGIILPNFTGVMMMHNKDPGSLLAY